MSQSPSETSHAREGTRRTRGRNSSQDIALIGVFAALIAVLAFTPPIPVGNFGVPITLQTLGVAITGLVLGPWRGAAAAGLYLVLGLLGLPIFAGFVGGFGVLAGPSAGYLLAFPLTALITGLLARSVLRRGTVRWQAPLLFLAALAGSFLATHPLGILGMSINLEVSLREAFFFDIVFWPGDVIKSLVAAGAAALVHRAAPWILAMR
ncbi:biotin transporter BioY [Nesterenkonia haasae]|uniref:biotin transporter BioY n=1 Tax=Nesterenkonia haasae TaxID=2587813 RepID=UPI0013907916|nr:biotin transporter BioY [Nesterenkonia haasae]NDK31052.1 biotin transporter BioY [Nesterenkonia haasae]